MSTGSFGSSIRNGLKIEIETIAAIDSATAAGTAMRRTRTMRLWRAATAKRASSVRLDRWGSEPNSPLLRRSATMGFRPRHRHVLPPAHRRIPMQPGHYEDDECDRNRADSTTPRPNGAVPRRAHECAKMSSASQPEQIELRPRRQELETGLRQFACDPRAPAWHRAVRAGHADAARRRRRRRAAPRSGSATPQSLDCCCFDRSMLSTSRTRSFRPWRSV